MKTRKRPVINNLADLERRPSRQFTDTVKTLIAESRSELDKHSIYYRKANYKFDELNKSFNDLEKLILEAEHNRPLYMRDEKLHQAFTQANHGVHYAETGIRDIKSGKIKQTWNEEAAKLTARLHQLERDETKKQKTSHIETYRKLLQANAQLNKYIIDEAKLSSCTPGRKHQAALDLIAQQEKVVRALEAVFDVEPTHPEIDDVQSRLEAAQKNAQYFEDNHEQALAEMRKKRTAAHENYHQAVTSINDAQLKHYANINTTLMHGVVRVYERFNAYKTAFDNALAENIKNKDEAAPYVQKLNAGKASLDTLMNQLWCDNYGHLKAKDIHDQFSSMNQTAKTKLLDQKPDSTALPQIMGAATGKPEAAKVSTTGIFKKTDVAASTEEKRQHLVRQAGGRDKLTFII